jgi:glycerophosphoryl diester phosphodiesterase
MIRQNSFRFSFSLNQGLSILLLMLTVLTFLAFKTTETRPVTIPKGFDWEGHRGCRGLMPENTLPAFLKALEFPDVITLELDLAVTKDNQLIVSHEPWFNPDICLKPNGDSIPKKDGEKLLIYQMTVAEVQAYDSGSKPYARFPNQQKMKAYKPTLREVVEAARAVRPNIRWNIEVKSQPDWDGLRHPPIEDFVRMVVSEIRSLGIEQFVTVQSFDVRALNALHRQAPDLQLSFLIENINGFESNLARLEFKPAIYSPYYLLINKKLVKELHARQIKLVPWTVNDVKSMRRLIRLGVDGIITDYPNLIGEVSGG